MLCFDRGDQPIPTMNIESAIEIFRFVLGDVLGTTREMNDDGAECSRFVILDEPMVEEMAEKLSHWWNDLHGADEIELTPALAAAFLEDTYPETDENSRVCNN